MKPGARENHQRPVRSYVLRSGRLTPAQQKALDQLYPLLGVPEGVEPLVMHDLFGRKAETVIEIGFGNGDATWRMACAEFDKNFIGIEVHPPGVGRLLQDLNERQITNVRVAMEDAVSFIEQRISGNSLDGVRIYFPDPWPKKRHHKRRIIQPAFIDLLAARMKPGAILHLATDWAPYSEHMLEVLQASDSFENLAEDDTFCPRPAWRPETKYERRGDMLGHEIHDLVFRKSL